MVRVTVRRPFSGDLMADSIQAEQELGHDPDLGAVPFGSITWTAEWLERIWHYTGGRNVSCLNQNAGVIAFVGVIVGVIALLR